jgi:23S rRNA pseudouridine2457 synthase
MLIAFHKPYGVLSQFTSRDKRHRTLAEFGFPAGVYPLGRLDHDSEGLLLLSDEAGLNHRLLNPDSGHWREYWAQVEHVPAVETLRRLENGVRLADRTTLPCLAHVLDPQPTVPDRVPPIRQRLHIPACWISLSLSEGKNRQVRRMTAAVGHPTLRLIRMRVGGLALGDLLEGEWRAVSSEERELLFRTY